MLQEIEEAGNPCQTIVLQEIEEAGTKVLSWDQALEMGRAQPAAAIPPQPSDLCTIMYTSGTTGNPKVGRVNH